MRTQTAIAVHDGERLIRFEHAEEFRSRPAWRDNVDPSAHKPVQILGGYAFSKDRYLACGLRSCRTMHGHGLLVRTEDGIETHMGRDCGESHFGDEWKDLYKEFQGRQHRELQTDRVTKFLAERDAKLSRAVATLAAVTELHNRINTVRNALGWGTHCGKAHDEAAKVGGRLIFYRRATDRERELEPGLRSVPVDGGLIFGIAEVQASDARRLPTRITELIVKPLRAVSSSEVLALKGKALDALAKSITAMDHLFQESEAFKVSAAQYLSPDNWQRFERFCKETPGLSLSDKERKGLARIVRDCSRWLETPIT